MILPSILNSRVLYLISGWVPTLVENLYQYFGLLKDGNIHINS
jgi:hypothetical protein